MKRLILMSIMLSLFSFSLVIGCGEAKKEMKEETPAEKTEEVKEAADTTMSDDEMMEEEAK